MLSEHFIGAISTAHKTSNTTLTKDAGIFYNEFQPHAALRSTFKKSASPQNGVAVSESHIFATQEGKSVVHVYSRIKGNQEALVPFNKKVTCLCLAAQDTLLVLGTEDGKVFVWEICTGREVATPQSHLQQTTSVAVDGTSNFLLSGSADSDIHVWSLPELMSFSSSDTETSDPSSAVSPRHRLTNHREGITSLVIGHSRTSVNIAVSASKDKSCIVWNYQTGELLRTFLLPSTPLCLTLDPADRGFYTAYEDGSVQLVDLYAQQLGARNELYNGDSAIALIQPSEASRWIAVNQELKAGLSLALSYDGSTLLSGHESGKVVAWNVSRGTYFSTVCDLGGPVTNLAFLPPSGFPTPSKKCLSTQVVVKPQLYGGHGVGNGVVPAKYSFASQFTGLEESRNEFDVALTHSSFPQHMLDDSLAELASWNLPASISPANGAAEADGRTEDSSAETAELEKENAKLKKELEAVRRGYQESFKTIEKLRKQIKN